MNLPNQLSTLRIFLVPVFVTSLFYFSHWSAAIFFVACLTDAVDGYLARLWEQKTVLGSYLDPVADKLLLLSGFIALSFMSQLPEAMRVPAWVTITVISRDVIILIGSVLIFVTTGTLKPQPHLVGKATTAFQMTTLLFSLLGAPDSLKMGLFYTTFILTAWSGLVYLRLGSRLLGT